MKRKILTRIADFGIVFITLMSIPLNIVAYFALKNSQYQLPRFVPPAIAIIIIVLAVFRKKIKLEVKIWAFIFVLFAAASFTLLLGLLDMASLWFLVSIIFAVFVSKKHEAMYIFIASFIVISITGVLMITKNTFIPLNYGFSSCQYACVIIRIINFLIIGFLIFYILKVFVKTMSLYVTELQNKYEISEKLNLALNGEMTEKIKNEELKANLEFKERELNYKKHELTETIIKLISFNKTLVEIKKSIIKDKNKDALKTISNNLNSNYNWQRFELSFYEIYPSFIANLKENYPELTETEVKLSSFLLMKLKTREIAEIMTISETSVSKYRNRLRKKLNIESGSDLHDFLSENK